MTVAADILVVGGGGFLGRHVCEALAEHGHHACIVSRTTPVEIVERHPDQLSFVAPESDAAINAAATARHVLYMAHRSRPADQGSGTRSEVEQNLLSVTRFTDQLFDRNPDARLVYFSSGGQIYGGGHDQPIPEDAELQPTTNYGLGKQLVENMLRYKVRTHGAKIEILRLANPVGRWQMHTSHGFVSAAIACAKGNRELTIFGEGRNARDYFDADDLAEFLVERIEQDKSCPGTYNIGTGKAMTELDVVQTVETTIGQTIRRRHQPARPFDLPYGVLETSRAENVLDWRVKTPLAETVAKIASALD